jgi:hypothetical protein
VTHELEIERQVVPRRELDWCSSTASVFTPSTSRRGSRLVPAKTFSSLPLVSNGASVAAVTARARQIQAQRLLTVQEHAHAVVAQQAALEPVHARRRAEAERRAQPGRRRQRARDRRFVELAEAELRRPERPALSSNAAASQPAPGSTPSSR